MPPTIKYFTEVCGLDYELAFAICSQIEHAFIAGFKAAEELGDNDFHPHDEEALYDYCKEGYRK